jgi:hypothetical protein
VIFAGPSLPPSLRPSDPALIWKPPVRQGELYQAALTRPAIIGIVDGYFEVTPTVWHKEILWAMAQGIHVYGCASIGALRAVELAPFGMKGIGKIYEAFRDGIIEDDDEVAVLHGPEELGYPPITEAMVNIRGTLDRALAEGVLDGRLAGRLAEIAKRLFYKDRTYPMIFLRGIQQGISAAALENLTRWLPDGRMDLKSLDSLGMLEAIREHIAAEPSPLEVFYSFRDTAAWEAASVPKVE